MFLCSKVGEYPNEFLHGVYKVLTGVTSREKAELTSYQLMEVSHV